MRWVRAWLETFIILRVIPGRSRSERTRNPEYILMMHLDCGSGLRPSRMTKMAKVALRRRRRNRRSGHFARPHQYLVNHGSQRAVNHAVSVTSN
jgi:hypothetical protein